MTSSYYAFIRTFNLVVGPFFTLTNVDNTKQRLVDAEPLGKRSKFLRVTQQSNLLQLES